MAGLAFELAFSREAVVKGTISGAEGAQFADRVRAGELRGDMGLLLGISHDPRRWQHQGRRRTLPPQATFSRPRAKTAIGGFPFPAAARLQAHLGAGRLLKMPGTYRAIQRGELSR